jgi:outer membrane receptor for ferrienterochelin and colicins
MKSEYRMVPRRVQTLLVGLGLGGAGLSGEIAPLGGAVELSTFVVTGTRTERLVTEAPVKTELIVASDLQAYNITSLRDALKLVPTARFENDCQNCMLNQIQLLGLSTDYTAILFDGAPLYSGLAKVYGADLFPAIFVDRIEVVKGGSSVLYGPEAMAGVVNLRTAEPIASALRASLGFESLRGDANEWEGSVRGDVVEAAANLSLTAYGFWQDREGLDLTTDGFTEIPRFENRVIGLQGWWRPLEGALLKANYQFMDQAHRGGDQLHLPEEQARVAESLAHRVHLAQAHWSQRVGDRFDYSLGFSYIFIERESFYGARGDNEQRAYEDAGLEGDVTEAFIAANEAAIDAVARRVWGLTENHVHYYESQFNHYFGDHTLSYGAQYRWEDLTDGSRYAADTVPTTEDDFSNLGFFVQDQWALTEDLELVPGIRWDRHDNVDGTIFSPRLAARWSATEAVTVRASWSTGFNAPGAFNEDKHIGVNNGGAIFLVNEPGLVEERSRTLSLGADYRPAAFEGRLNVHSQLHHTALEDSFEIDDSGEFSGDPNLWYRINGPDATIWVWENNLNWRLNERLRLDAGLSWIRARLDEKIDRVTGLSTDEFLKRPEWTGHFGIAYENHDLFDLNAFLSFTGEMLAVGEDADIWRRTDPFYVLDLSASKDFDGVLGAEHLTITVGVDNLFDDRQKDLQDNGEERDPTYLYGPVQPRTFFIRVSANW